MKKMFFAAIAVVGFSAVGMAQQQVKFGPKAGVNFANVSGLESDMKVGFHVGAVAEIKFNEKFSIQPEVLYSTQGTKFDIGQGEVKWNNDYINVPIMAKYYIIDGFSVEAGPQIGFLMKAEQKGTIGDLKGTQDVKDLYNYKSVDFGIGLGLAYDLPMGFFINARYNLGLSKMRDVANIGGISTKDQKNNVIQVGVGYKFD